MYCGKCGTKLPDEEYICPKCGADMTLPPDYKERLARPAGKKPGLLRRVMDKIKGN